MTAQDYVAPRSEEEALEFLHAFGSDATVLAGGQDVVPLMNQGRLRPPLLVDISRLNGLAAVSSDGAVRIGALVTHRQLERHPVITHGLRLLAEAAAQIGGGVQVRNRGTVGGAVCAAGPAYDLPPVLLAAEAVFVLRSRGTERRVPAGAFWLGPGRTTRAPDELLTQIEVPPLPARSGSAYVKLKFTEGGYTIASAACVISADAGGRWTAARVALGGVASVPVRLSEVERALTGAVLAGGGLNDILLDDLAALAAAAIREPISDVMAGGAYRRAMAGEMVRRAVRLAGERAMGDSGPR